MRAAALQISNNGSHHSEVKAIVFQQQLDPVSAIVYPQQQRQADCQWS
ncbi:hypothetical protein IFO70_17155 [Phormidium tenue FACHB-886]|nr:hypothetical protein [Phormidium tenue FACHB-886]